MSRHLSFAAVRIAAGVFSRARHFAMLGVRIGLSSFPETWASRYKTMSSLQYSSLDPDRREIRVLTILPDRWSAGIRCDLSIVSLDEDPVYTALSYVWGDPHDTTPIVVEGSRFQATKNLVAAMRRLRSSKDPLAIWIDAICIDQKNLYEKSQQITMMGRIYESASEVAVYLGESGILDILPAEEIEAWSDAPMQEWHRDDTLLGQDSKPPPKAFVECPQTMENFGAYFAATLDPQVERADPNEHPMWVIFDPTEGIKDQGRVDTFFKRQTESDYGLRASEACRLFRESQEGAFAILNQLSNGRCLKSCLKGDSYSVAWINALKVIDHISKLPWWSRVWIMQESILPKGRVFAVYGENRADDIMLFEDGGGIIPRHHERGQCCKAFWHSLPTWQQDVLRRFAKLMDPFNHIRDINTYISSHPLDRLYHLVGRARHLQATDARDKIFGLLGVAVRAGQQDPPTASSGQQDISMGQEQITWDDSASTDQDTGVEAVAAGGADATGVAKMDVRPDMLGIVPDYKQTAVEVYTKFAIRLINRQGQLGLLAVKEKVPVGLEELPSWVPKWSPSVDGTTDYIVRARMQHFLACSPSTTEQPKLVDSYALAVVGRRFDRIAAITRPFHQAVTSVLEAVKEIEAFFGVDRDPDALYQNSTPLASAVWRTMVGDLLYYVDKELKSDTIMFRRIEQPQIQLLSIATLIWEGVGANTYILYNGEQISLEDQRMLDFAETARRSFWYASEAKSFFKTELGFIGCAPADAAVGDEIAIVDASPLPFLLRQKEPVATLPLVSHGQLYEFTDSWFRFVGCPYVCGIMDGEAGLPQSVGPTEALEEYIEAVKQRAGKMYDRELHLVSLDALQDTNEQYLFLA